MIKLINVLINDNVRIVSKSPTEVFPPIGAFIDLHSYANLPCLVNLGLYPKNKPST